MPAVEATRADERRTLLSALNGSRYLGLEKNSPKSGGADSMKTSKSGGTGT